MLLSDALNILGLKDSPDAAQIKKAYLTKIKQFHPDVNPAGLEMTKLLNQAMETISKASASDFEKASGFASPDRDFGEEISEFLKNIVNLTGIEIEICGVWVWMGGDTKPHKEALKEAGAKWAAKKKMWYFRPASERKSYRRSNFSMNEIREKHGSSKIRPEWSRQLNAAG